MKQYLDNLEMILETGTVQQNRTGTETTFISGTFAKYDLRDGFPLITTKKMPTKAIVSELIGFLRGYDNAEEFRKLGCNIWTANANNTKEWTRSPFRKGADDLGRIYGVQWRRRRDYKISTSHKMDMHLASTGYSLKLGNYSTRIYHREFDQLQHVIEQIKNNPTNRRIIMNAWNPNEEDEMALPPCHCSYHFTPCVARNELDLCMHQRSADYFLGVPFNIASASLLLSIIAKVTGYTPRYFTHFMDDSHVYTNHIEQCKLQLSRKPLELCSLEMDTEMWDLTNTDAFANNLEVDDFTFINYISYDPIKGEMAI